MIVLRGTPACPGTARGRALLVSDPGQTAPDVRGFVLVVEFATPLLYPFLEGACAILAERGGVASHAATLARELALPCVVRLPELFRFITDGADVYVDGSSGEVHVAS